MTDNNWEITTNRFVLFFDILGFKDMVQLHDHEYVLNKLNLLKEEISKLDNAHKYEQAKNFKISEYQTKSATFSDSIIFFSKSGKIGDAYKILLDASFVCNTAISNGIAIKGALSFGKITVDFEKSLFFGQPIIDAYLLHENLQMLTVIADHNFENQYNMLKKINIPGIYVDYKANLKFGKVTHKLLRPSEDILDESIKELKKHYSLVSGYPRIYIDNTLEFYNSFLPPSNKPNISKIKV